MIDFFEIFNKINQKDLEEILALRDNYDIPNEKIYLMPEGINIKEL